MSNQSKKVFAPPIKKLSCNTLISIENMRESKGLCTILPSIKSKFPIWNWNEKQTTKKKDLTKNKLDAMENNLQKVLNAV